MLNKFLLPLVLLVLVAVGFVATYHAVQPQASVYTEHDWILYTQPLRAADPTRWHPTRQYKTFEQCEAVMESINNAGKDLLADCAR